MGGKVLAGIPDPDAEHREMLKRQRRRPRIAGAIVIAMWAIGVASTFVPGAESWNEILFFPGAIAFIAWVFLRLRLPSRSTPLTRGPGDRVAKVALTPAYETRPFVRAVGLFILIGLFVSNLAASVAILTVFIALFWLLGRRQLIVRPHVVEIVNYLSRQRLEVVAGVTRFEFEADEGERRSSNPQILLHPPDGEPVVFDGKWTTSGRTSERFVEDANVVLGVSRIQDAPASARPATPQDRLLN